MTKDDILRMAKENGIVIVGEAMFRFADLVAAAEREACAVIAETAEPYCAADLIRARSRQKPASLSSPRGSLGEEA